MKSDLNVRVHFPTYIAKESGKDVQVSEDLSEESKQQVNDLICEFPDVFTDVLRTTDLV